MDLENDEIFFSDSESEYDDEGVDLSDFSVPEENVHLPELDFPIYEDLNEPEIVEARGGGPDVELLRTQISILKNFIQIQSQELQVLVHQKAADKVTISQLQNSIESLVKTLSLSQDDKRPESSSTSQQLDGRPVLGEDPAPGSRGL